MSDQSFKASGDDFEARVTGAVVEVYVEDFAGPYSAPKQSASCTLSHEEALGLAYWIIYQLGSEHAALISAMDLFIKDKIPNTTRYGALKHLGEEVMELALADTESSNFGEEIADVILTTMIIARQQGINPIEEIWKKIGVNNSRTWVEVSPGKYKGSK